LGGIKKMIIIMIILLIIVIGLLVYLSFKNKSDNSYDENAMSYELQKGIAPLVTYDSYYVVNNIINLYYTTVSEKDAAALARNV